MGAKGVRVVGVDADSQAPALRSKYVEKRFVVTNPVDDEEKFIGEISEIGRNEALNDKVFLLPTADEYVLAFARYWSELREWFYPVFETDINILLDCLEKTRMYKVAEKSGVPYPRTLYSPVSSDDLRLLSYPLVVKPFNRRSLESIRKGVFRLRFCRNGGELAEAVEFLERLDTPFVVQEYIPGGDDELYTAGIFAYKGKLAAAFTGRKLRQSPPNLGQCCYGEVVRETRIVEYAEKFTEITGYTGIAQVEFKKHKNEFYLMEFNPRPWLWNSLSTFAGVNLPWIACETIRTGEINECRQERFSGTWHYLSMDIFYNVVKNRNVSPWTAIVQGLKADCHALWDFRDPLPAIRSSLNTILRLVRGLKGTVLPAKAAGGCNRGFH